MTPLKTMKPRSAPPPHGRGLGVAVLAGWLVLLVCSGCNGGESDPYVPAWATKGWFSFGLLRYDAPPAKDPPTGPLYHPPEWSHRILVNGQMMGPVSPLDKTAGEGTVARLRAMDTVDLRKRYAESLTDFEVLKDRLRTSSDYSFPVEVMSIYFRHYEETDTAAQIEDASQTTPLVGVVVLPVGSDPAVPDNPELTALVEECLRIHDAWVVRFGNKDAGPLDMGQDTVPHVYKDTGPSDVAVDTAPP